MKLQQSKQNKCLLALSVVTEDYAGNTLYKCKMKQRRIIQTPHAARLAVRRSKSHMKAAKARLSSGLAQLKICVEGRNREK